MEQLEKSATIEAAQLQSAAAAAGSEEVRSRGLHLTQKLGTNNLVLDVAGERVPPCSVARVGVDDGAVERTL